MMPMFRIEEMITIICQVVGMVLPVYSIIIIVRRDINKVSSLLLISNLGALVMNGAYFLMIRANVEAASMMSLKIKNLGNVVFSVFFFTYLFNFIFQNLKERKIRHLMKLWYVFEAVYICIVFNDDWNYLAFESTNVIMNERFNVHKLVFTMGPAYVVRSVVLATGMFAVIAYLIYKLIKASNHKERMINLGLIIALMVIFIPLIFTTLQDLIFDPRPVCASIVGMLVSFNYTRGRESMLRDMWRGWLIEHMEDPFILVGPGNVFMDANLSAKTNFTELGDIGTGDELPEHLRCILDEEEGPISLNGRFYKRTMTQLEAGKKVCGLGILMTDITKQRELMDQLNEAKQKAEEANEAKSNFLSNISHEIRTPMNAIVGMTEILQRTQLDDSQRDYLMNIQHSGGALIAIINDILDFSKIEAGKMEIIPEKYEPMSMLSDLGMIFLTRIGHKKVELLYDIDPNLPYELYGDTLRIRQIIINLVNNAIKFTENGSVTVKLECVEEEIFEEKVMACDLQYMMSVPVEERESLATHCPELTGNLKLRITVTDTGQGIKQEDIDKLFGSFSQVDTRKNRSKEGTGLGLAICKLLSEQMGGSIWVESVYGQGSTFGFEIPQGICSETRAATVSKKAVISAYMSTKELNEAIIREAERFGVEYLKPEETIVFDPEGKTVDYFFIDEIKYEELRPYVKGRDCHGHMECVLLRNPLVDAEYGDKVRLVNKPFYSLPFCKIINGEKLIDKSKDDKILNFVAPNARVLIVDDNETNLKVATGLLAPLKMTIDTAESGMEAIKIVQEMYHNDKAYDMIFMDHMMPVMDGVETTERIRALPGAYYQEVPIIALTANAVAGARETFRKAGMVDFVAKPIDLKDICKKIKNNLRRDLVVTVEEIVFKEPDEEALKDIPEEYLNIKGIDTLAGVKASGGFELWKSLLGDYCKVVEMKISKIEKCLLDDLIKDYTIEVHALKSASRAIGALELSDKFYEMEKCGNEGHVDHIHEHTAAILAEYKELKENLMPLIPKNTDDKKGVSMDIVNEALEGIKDCMDSFDIDGADVKLKELEGYILPEAVEAKMGELSALVADVAMDEVIELCSELQGMLS